MTPAAASDVPAHNRISPRLRFIVKRTILIGIIAWWFWSNTWPGLFSGFHPDDVMNLHFAYRLPVKKLVVDNLVPFTNDYRPAGQAVYRTIYTLWGFQPFPFRVVSYFLLALNIVVLYRFAKHLTGSTEMAYLSAFAVAFHRRAEDLYRNNGTLYDVLCFFFTYSTLLFYVSRRQRRLPFTWKHMLAFYALLTVALNSKEVAVIIPALLWCYELIYAPPRAFGAIGRWFIDRKLPLWFASFVTIAAAFGKMYGENPFKNNGGYALSFTWKHFFEASNHYLSDLFCNAPDKVPPFAVVLALGSLVLIAAITRQRYLLFAACIALLAPLPVVFIPPRGLFAYTIAWGGWAIFVGSFVAFARDWLWRVIWHRPALPPNTLEPERVFLFIFAFLAMIQFQNHTWPIEWVEYDSAKAIRVLASDLRQRHPHLPRHSSILLVNDAFDVDNYTPFFTAQLLYGDKTLALNRTKMMAPESARAALQAHQHVFEYKDGRYDEIKCATAKGPLSSKVRRPAASLPDPS